MCLLASTSTTLPRPAGLVDWVQYNKVQQMESTPETDQMKRAVEADRRFGAVCG